MCCDYSIECPDVVSQLQECEVPSMSPSQVCMECFASNRNATWLSYLTCVEPNVHLGARVTALVESNQLIYVRPPNLPRHLDVGRIALCHHVPKCSRKAKCHFAHSEFELDYWRWERAKQIFCSQLNKMVCSLCVHACV